MLATTIKIQTIILGENIKYTSRPYTPKNGNDHGFTIRNDHPDSALSYSIDKEQ